MLPNFPAVGGRLECSIIIYTMGRPKTNRREHFGLRPLELRHCQQPVTTHHQGKLYCRLHDPERDIVAEWTNPKRGRGPYY